MPPAQEVDDVVKTLLDCGLAQAEARAFAHLTRLGQSKVADLAKASGLKRAQTYQLLATLEKRGLVEGTLTRPRQYLARSPERVVAALVDARAADLKAVESHQTDLADRLRLLAGNKQPTQGGDSLRILQDRNQITGQLSRTLKAARSEASVVASARSLFRLLLDEGLEKDFRQAASRKVKIRILTDILPGQEEVVERISDFAQVRHMLVPRPLRFLLADDREIVQYVTTDPLGQAGKETALWVDARDHVQAQRAFFDDAWGLAMDAPTRLEEIAHGRASEHLQVVKGRFTRYEKEKEMLLRATREVCATFDALEVSRLKASGLDRALESRVRAGVKVRLVVPRGSAVTIKGADVRYAEPQGLPVALVDKAEALLVFPGKGSDAVTALREYGVWLSLSASVDALQGSFEAQWDSAKR